MKTSGTQAVIQLLSEFLAGSLSSSEALAAWPSVNEHAEEKLMGKAWEALYHFDIDSDIRAKEPAYEIHQRVILQKILDELKSSVAKSQAR